MNSARTSQASLMRTADQIRALVSGECRNQSNKLDPSFFRFHIEVVDRYASQLCPLFGADPGLVRIASYIHDIAAIRDYSTLSVHHLRGAEEAQRILAGKISLQESETIADAIRNHNSPVTDASPEAVTLSHADALSKFDSPVFWISYAHKRRFDTIDESLAWYRKLCESGWNAMLPEAKLLGEKSHEESQRIVAGLTGN